MTEYFPEVKSIKYEGPDSKNPLAFKYYNSQEVVLGKTMALACTRQACKTSAKRHVHNLLF